LFPENITENLTKSEKYEWIDCIDKLIRIDKYEKTEIKEIVEYFRNDNFWKAQFQSLLKLRTKNKDKIKYIDFFKNKMKSEKETPQKPAEPKYVEYRFTGCEAAKVEYNRFLEISKIFTEYDWKDMKYLRGYEMPKFD
jgi:hypothetical protein